MARGTLRVYLGMAPGVGKTYAMLDEGRRRLDRGTDVLVGFVEDHGRVATREKIAGLEVVPRRTVVHRGATFQEMDVEELLRRHPEVALVDELAHTNVPGPLDPTAGQVPGHQHAKRWEDVEDLLEAGIDVITTVNIQHLESLNDVVTQITGVKQRETVPDEVVRRADQIELVDMSAQALRRRMAHGNIYPPEKVDAALSNYFREGNLSALRELALLWVADRVDDALERYRSEHHIEQSWPARERVVVALTGGPEGEALIRRGARIVGRSSGGELLALYVARSDGLIAVAPAALARLRALVESLDGTFHQVVDDSPARAILDFSQGANASQIVIGDSRRSRLQTALSPGVGASVVRGSGDMDVHVVTHREAARQGSLRRRPSLLSRRRQLLGWILCVAVPAALTVLFEEVFGRDLPTILMVYLAATVLVALVGGLWPALVTAVLAGLLTNWFFTPPLRTWNISNPQNLLAIVILVVVGGSVATVVDYAARRAREAARARAEAETLSTLAGSILRGEDALPALLARAREAFSLDAVSLLERAGDRTGWKLLVSDGAEPPVAPDKGSGCVPAGDNLVLAVRGPELAAADQRILTALAAQAQVVVEREQARQQAREAKDTLERSSIRTTLLAAVSHDLRTPLASIKASVGTLRQLDVHLDADDQAELLATIEHSADRLDALLSNLLDMSRIASGAVGATARAVALDEVLPIALSGVARGRVVSEVPEDLPLVLADPGLLERVLANVAENAARFAPADDPVRVTAAAVSDGVSDGVVIRIVDRGPGVDEPDLRRIFEPFQRLGDRPRGDGVGLGLAVARGFSAAMGGVLDAEDTPGGGLTVSLWLPRAASPAPAPAAVRAGLPPAVTGAEAASGSNAR